MKKNIDKNTCGQTALILILLTAAALIFLAITLNWGRIAQVKSLLTVAADEASTTLASDAASYGEMEKQTYLENENNKSSLDGVLLSVILLVIAIILCFTPLAPAAGWALGLAIAGMVMTFVSIVLQLVWINPMISALWNNLQKNQPVQQQFYEQGITTALESSVTDQVNITDYFDWNASGVYGSNAAGFPRDTVGRFALFYTDRLKMLNQPDIPQVVFFYDQLAELMNGETCGQNQGDNYNYGIPVNAGCQSAGVDPFSSPPCTPTSACTTAGINCVLNPIDPICQEKIPNGFQLDDGCTDYNTSSPTYNPYCDPCCQPLSVPNTLYCTPSTSGTGSPSATCTGTTSTGAACTCNPLSPPFISLRPSNCPADEVVGGVDTGAPAQCWQNNPYGVPPANTYGLLYDPAFQEYNNNLSFLDLFGRDQQLPPATTPPVMTPNVMTPSTVTPTLAFPNGVFPFFWLMNEYSAEVDNINPTVTALIPSQYHWCTAAALPGGATYVNPAAFPDLAELTLPYTCAGQDCCVNYLSNTLTSNGTLNSAPITITLVNGPVVNMTTPATGVSYDAAGSSVTVTATASATSPDTIAQISLYDVVNGLIVSCATNSCSNTGSNVKAATYNVYAVATDSNGVSSTSATITINVIDPPTVTITPLGTLVAGATVTVTATATAAPGDTLNSVAFYNGATSLGSVGSSPYSVTWTVPASGTSYSLTAVATDAHGLSTTSTAVTGTVP